jgi:hypothetical protein
MLLHRWQVYHFGEGYLPTKLPRINVTVTQAQHGLLLELGRLQGRSASSLLRELLDATTPTLQALLPAMRTAADLTNKAAGELASVQDATREAVRGSLGQVEAQWELAGLALDDALQEAFAGSCDDAGAGVVSGDGEDRSERPASEDRSGAANPTQPPYSNTGVSFADGGRSGRPVRATSGSVSG